MTFLVSIHHRPQHVGVGVGGDVVIGRESRDLYPVHVIFLPELNLDEAHAKFAILGTSYSTRIETKMEFGRMG